MLEAFLYSGCFVGMDWALGLATRLGRVAVAGAWLKGGWSSVYFVVIKHNRPARVIWSQAVFRVVLCERLMVMSGMCGLSVL